MSRYWNGHQWKNLPAEQPRVDAAPAEAAAVLPVDGTRPAAVAAAPPCIATATAAAHPPALAHAVIVPTHAEYGDVFVAASAVPEAG